MTESNLPVLIVMIPLLVAATLPMLGKSGNRAWFIATATTAALFVISILILRKIGGEGGVVTHLMGNWKVPWGIELRIDSVNGFVTLIITGIAFVVTLGSRLSIQKEIPADRLPIFYTIWLCCITGLIGITVTGDMFNVYVLLEITSLATYALIAMGKGADRKALTASLNYLVLGTIGASFILLGIGYLYMVTGTLNMADVSVELQKIYHSWHDGGSEHQKTLMAAFAFLAVGLFIKVGLFPLHAWLPNAYTYAPSAVSALLSATATKVGAYITLRFFFTILGAHLVFELIPTGTILLIMGCIAVLVGSYLAIRQTNLKRMLAYSSVAQIGYIAMGIGLASETGLTAGIIHLFNHAVIKGGLFLALAAFACHVGKPELHRLAGMGRKMPFTMAAFTAGGLALIGVPLTAGFISKWYLVLGLVEKSLWTPAAVVLIGSLLAVIYVWRVVEVIYLHKPAEADADVKEAPLSLVISTWILVGASIFFGVNATLTVKLAQQAAHVLLGGGL
jgi:multicomponent Na+:H+ antiporter subunit D